jgi:hypothetical protein
MKWELNDQIISLQDYMLDGFPLKDWLELSAAIRRFNGPSNPKTWAMVLNEVADEQDAGVRVPTPDGLKCCCCGVWPVPSYYIDGKFVGWCDHCRPPGIASPFVANPYEDLPGVEVSTVPSVRFDEWNW